MTKWSMLNCLISQMSTEPSTTVADLTGGPDVGGFSWDGHVRLGEVGLPRVYLWLCRCRKGWLSSI